MYRGILWFVGWILLSILSVIPWQMAYRYGPEWLFGHPGPTIFTIFGTIITVAACWAIGLTGLFHAVGK